MCVDSATDKMTILDRFEMNAFFPAPVGERRAQALPANVCALVATCPDGPQAFLRLIGLVSGSRRLGVIFQGTFGREPRSIAPALERSKVQVLGQEVFFAETDAELTTALSANVESVFLVVAEAALELPSRNVDRQLLGMRSAGDFVGLLVAKGPVVAYSPSDKAIEVFGSESFIVALIGQLSSEQHKEE